MKRSKTVTTTERFTWDEQKNDWVPVSKTVETEEADPTPVGFPWGRPYPHPYPYTHYYDPSKGTISQSSQYQGIVDVSRDPHDFQD